ncbi:MAG: hypothetical protein FWK01_24545 [Pantanalinema sp. GBBB05]|nr:hypothetical protein [Pantanalinema sp. GBBB05]
MDRTPQQAAQDLLEILSNAVTVVDGSTGAGVKVGTSITFRYRDPVTGQTKTATGIAWTDCPPGQVTGVRTGNGWIVFSPNASRIVRDTVTEYRRRRQTSTSKKFRVGVLYRQRLNKTTPMVCYSEDAPDDLPPPEPPKDPDHPKPGQAYLHTYVSAVASVYPERLNAWLFEPPNHCGLGLGTPGSLTWLPSFPAGDSWFGGVYVSTFSTFDAILRYTPDNASATFRNYYQIIYHYDPATGDRIPFCTIKGVITSSNGDEPAPIPDRGWILLGGVWTSVEIQELPGVPFVSIGNDSAEECAPPLPDYPLPNVPPRDPPDGPEATWAIYYKDDLLQSALKLKEISTKDPVSKGEIVFVNNARRIVVLKYGDSRYDNAPTDSMFLGYCRLSIFVIPGLDGADFTERTFTWDEAGEGLPSVLAIDTYLRSEVGLTWNRFTKILAAHSWFTDDQSGWFAEKRNPLYAELLESAEEQQVRNFVSRHLRHLRVDGARLTAYLLDPSSPPYLSVEDFSGTATDEAPPFACYLTEQTYQTAKVLALKTTDAGVKIKRFEVFSNPAPPVTESYANPAYILVAKDRQGIPFKARSLGIPEAQATLPITDYNSWQIMTIVCAPV